MATTYSTYRLGAVDSLKMPSHFSVHVYYDQTAGWIGIPLGMEVGLGPGDIVLDGDTALPSTQSDTASPTFRPTALVRIPAGPHFIHNPYCGLNSARSAALVAILRIIATRLDFLFTSGCCGFIIVLLNVHVCHAHMMKYLVKSNSLLIV